jgi:2-oxo-4-hydroxy-4-carboxy-5-ureidoimidazoline decarboxylase
LPAGARRETLILMTASASRPPSPDGPAGPAGTGGLAEFNGLPADAARRALLACCSSQRWAGVVAAGRPFPSAPALLRCSDAAVAGLAPADLREALAGHPRIGERAGAGGGWSQQEQAGVAGADTATLRALAAGNEVYQRRFGHIYLVCATGRTAAELLALLRARLGNEPGAEWDVVRSELRKINRIRLGKLLGGSGSGSSDSDGDRGGSGGGSDSGSTGGGRGNGGGGGA